MNFSPSFLLTEKTPDADSHRIPDVPRNQEVEDSRRWLRSCPIGSKSESVPIDMKVIEPYKKVISHAGYYHHYSSVQLGRNPEFSPTVLGSVNSLSLSSSSSSLSVCDQGRVRNVTLSILMTFSFHCLVYEMMKIFSFVKPPLEWMMNPGSGPAIITFTACYLPDRSRRDYNYVMDHLFM